MHCLFDMQGAFITGHPTSTWRPDICIWRLCFTSCYLLAPFLKNWPLRQVFRGHFGPQVKIFWLKQYTTIFCFPLFILDYGTRLTFTFQEYVCFGQLGWKHKGRIQHLFHLRFQSSVKCEKTICSGKLQATPSNPGYPIDGNR